MLTDWCAFPVSLSTAYRIGLALQEPVSQVKIKKQTERMDIGRKKISENEYKSHLERLLLCINNTPTHGIEIYNIIYDLISSKPSYETRLYSDICHFFRSLIDRQSTKYLRDFGSYKKIVFALSSLCPLLHDTLKKSHRRLDEMAFLIWEKEMLRDRNIGPSLVDKIRSEVTTAAFFGYKSPETTEIDDICRKICFEEKMVAYDHVTRVLEAPVDKLLQDCCIRDRSFVLQHAPVSTKCYSGPRCKALPGAKGPEYSIVSHLYMASETVSDSDAVNIPDYNHMKVCQLMAPDRDVRERACSFRITYSDIKYYIDTLSYIVPDPSSPLLYYIVTYELPALTKIAYESSVENVSFEEYTTFAFLKLISETKRMKEIFLRSSYPKVLKVLDRVLIEKKKTWLQEMFRLVTKDPVLLKRYFNRLRFFPSFSTVFEDVFRDFLNKFISERVGDDLEEMHQVLTSLTEHTDKYLSMEWVDFLRETFSKYLNEIKDIAKIFINFCGRMLSKKDTLYTTFSESSSGSARISEAYGESYKRVAYARESSALPEGWMIFSDLFVFLSLKCEFSELYILKLQDRLLESAVDLDSEKAFLDLLFSCGCPASFKKKAEKMIKDVKMSKMYLFRKFGDFFGYVGELLGNEKNGPLSSQERFLSLSGPEKKPKDSLDRLHVRFVDMLEDEPYKDRRDFLHKSTRHLSPTNTEYLLQHRDEYLLVKPYVLNSGSWSLEAQSIHIPPEMLYILDFFESKFKEDFNMQYFNWIHNRSSIVIDIFLKKKVRIELSTFQYCILDSLREKSTLKDILSMCKGDEKHVAETLDLFVRIGLVIKGSHCEAAGQSFCSLDTSCSLGNGLLADTPNDSQCYLINMEFDKEFLEIPQAPKFLKPRKPADAKQACQSLICSIMKKKKTLAHKALRQEAKAHKDSVFEEVLRSCVVQGYLEKDGDIYKYVP